MMFFHTTKPEARSCSAPHTKFVPLLKRMRPAALALLAVSFFASHLPSASNAQEKSVEDGEDQSESADDEGTDAGEAEDTAIDTVEAVETVQADSSADEQTQFEDKLVSVFENGTADIQYGYIENLGDGRGFTAGRAGFTSGTGDLLDVVEKYSKLNPGNALEGYTDALRTVNGTDSVAGLDGLAEAWAQSVGDPAFIAAQDAVNDTLYRAPARALAASVGADLPLTKAAIYEAGIQHGYGDDPDSVNALVERATVKVGGTPATGVDEKEWLGAFLEERRNDLLAPSNAETADVWQDSVGRADAMLDLYKSGNFNLDQKVELTVFGSTHRF